MSAGLPSATMTVARCSYSPDLKRELQKPGNGGTFMEMLLVSFRANVRPDNSSETLGPTSFSVGPYRLDAQLAGVPRLVEFSMAEYAIMGRSFKGEKSYNAPPVQFLGRWWQLIVQTVNGRICKIAPHMEFASRQEADHVETDVLQYCVAQLGRPVSKRSILPYGIRETATLSSRQEWSWDRGS